MLIESIEYTATLIEYVAKQTRQSVSDVVSEIGEQNLFNLCHNAPMNRHLPMARIAREVIQDNDISETGLINDVVENPEYGKQIAALVSERTSDNRRYPRELFGALLDV